MTAITPSYNLLSKIAAILQSIDGTPRNAVVNIEAIRLQLADREVSAWLDAMHKTGMIPTATGMIPAVSDDDSLDDIDIVLARIDAELREPV